MTNKDTALKALRAVDPKTITEVQKQALLKFQIAVEDFTHELFENVPDCKDRDVAVSKLLVSKMLCVQAITHEGFPSPVQTKEKVAHASNQKEETPYQENQRQKAPANG